MWTTLGNLIPVLVLFNSYSHSQSIPSQVRLLGAFPYSGGWPVGAKAIPAFELAVEEINNNSNLLPNTTVLATSFDDECNTVRDEEAVARLGRSNSLGEVAKYLPSRTVTCTHCNSRGPLH